MGNTVEGHVSYGRFLRRYYAVILLSFPCVLFGAYAPFMPVREGPVVGALVGAVFLLIGLWGLGWLAVRFFSIVQWVEVGPDGIHWQGFGNKRSAKWSDISLVYRNDEHILVNGDQPSEWNRNAHVRIVLRDRSQAEFHEVLTNYDEVAAIILGHTADSLFPKMLREFERTGEAEFGSLEINRDGLVLNGKKRSWEDLRWWVSGGWFHVGSDQNVSILADVTEVPLSTIPNYLVALSLINLKGKEQSPPPPPTN